MKKFLAIILSLIFVFAVSGCKENADNKDKKASSTKENNKKNYTKDEGIKLPDGSIIFLEGSISNNAKIEFKDENDNLLLTAEDIFKVSAKYFPEGCYGIQLEFNESGTEKFKTATQQNLGKTISIFIDDELIFAPIINEIINDDKVVISNYNFKKEEVFDIYDSLTK